MTYGDGVYKSTDDGKTWIHIGLEDTRQIGALIVDPSNPESFSSRRSATLSDPTRNRGIYRTTDGGKSWTRVLGQGRQNGRHRRHLRSP